MKRNLSNWHKPKMTANHHLWFGGQSEWRDALMNWWMLLPGWWWCFSNSRWWTWGRWRGSRWWKIKGTLRIIHSFGKCLYILEYLFNFNIKTLFYRKESNIISYILLFIFPRSLNVDNKWNKYKLNHCVPKIYVRISSLSVNFLGLNASLRWLK